LMVAVGPGGTIDACYFNASDVHVCEQNGGILDANGNCIGNVLNKFQTLTCPPPGSPPCGAPPPPTPWLRVWVVNAFDSNAIPQCNCVYAHP
jgi:hypothetical protein